MSYGCDCDYGSGFRGCGAIDALIAMLVAGAMMLEAVADKRTVKGTGKLFALYCTLQVPQGCLNLHAHSC